MCFLHVLGPPESEKHVFKKCLYVCVYVVNFLALDKKRTVKRNLMKLGRKIGFMDVSSWLVFGASGPCASPPFRGPNIKKNSNKSTV